MIHFILKKIVWICRNTLQIGKDETLEKLRNSEENQLKLKGDLETTTKQLINNCQELAQSQTELKKSRREINVSGKEISCWTWNLDWIFENEWLN